MVSCLATLIGEAAARADSAARKIAAKSDLAREMLRKRIAVERFRELRRKALPLAEAAGYVSDEDVFRDIS